MDRCNCCGISSDHFIIGFHFQIHLIFHLDNQGKAIARNPGNPEDNEYIRNYLQNPNRPEVPLSPEVLAARLNKFLHRKHVDETAFRRYHISNYQGNISSEAKQAISSIWNNFPFCRSLANIYISSLRRATLLKFGLSYIGNAVSLFYNGETKEREVDSTLEAFLTQDKEVIIVKISRSRRLTLKNLAAERVCLSLSNRDSLQKLATSTQIPNPCVKALERCI